MNNIFLDLGVVKIYWYSVILLIAFLIGGALALKEAKKHNISEEFMTNYFFYLVPIVIIGARLYFVIFNFDYYKDNLIDILKVWEGGLAIHGGIIAGLIFTYFYTKKYKVRFLRLLDIAVVSVIIGQVIGRWGNFMNGEAYGPATTLEHLQSLPIPYFIIKGMNIGGTYYIPTFFYESVWNLIGFIILLIVRQIKRLKVGILTSIYLIWYGIGRCYIESLRQDSLMLGDIKVAQLVSIIMIIAGIVLFMICKKGSPFDNLYRKPEANESDRV